MSNRELPMMPWYPDQFAASTAGWTFTERAIYRALLDLQWQQGRIDVASVVLSRALDVRASDFRRCWRKVGPKFAAVEGGLQNYRLEQHRLAALELRRKKVAGGLSRQAQLRAQLAKSTSTPQALPTGVLQHPSPSLRRREEPLPLTPSPQAGKGNNGANAPSPKRKPRAIRNSSRTAWNRVLEAAQQGITSVNDALIDEAVRQIGGYTRLSQSHVAERGANRERFREAYETLLDKREDDPEGTRQRKEAEPQTVQCAKPHDEDMPF